MIVCHLAHIADVLVTYLLTYLLTPLIICEADLSETLFSHLQFIVTDRPCMSSAAHLVSWPSVLRGD